MSHLIIRNRCGYIPEKWEQSDLLIYDNDCSDIPLQYYRDVIEQNYPRCACDIFDPLHDRYYITYIQKCIPFEYTIIYDVKTRKQHVFDGIRIVRLDELWISTRGSYIIVLPRNAGIIWGKLFQTQYSSSDVSLYLSDYKPKQISPRIIQLASDTIIIGGLILDISDKIHKIQPMRYPLARYTLCIGSVLDINTETGQISVKSCVSDGISAIMMLIGSEAPVQGN